MKQLVGMTQMSSDISTPREQKKGLGGIGTGMLSVLMVLIILLLTAFAVLSYTTAVAEARLTEKTVQSAEDYYAADAAAQKVLFMLYTQAEACSSADEFLQTLPQSSGQAVLDWQQDETGAGYQLTCTVPIDEARQLRMQLLVEDADGKAGLTLILYRVESTAVWEDENINVWDGT